MRREAAVGERELFDLVPGGGRVEKIPGERAVEHPVFERVHASREQRALQILHVVPRLAALGRKEQRERRGIAVPVCLRRQKYRERVIFGNAEMRERLAAFGIKPVIGDGVPRPLQRGAEVFFRLRRHTLACALKYGLFLFLLHGRLQAPLFNELLEAEPLENFIRRAAVVCRAAKLVGGNIDGRLAVDRGEIV